MNHHTNMKTIMKFFAYTLCVLCITVSSTWSFAQDNRIELYPTDASFDRAQNILTLNYCSQNYKNKNLITSITIEQTGVSFSANIIVASDGCDNAIIKVDPNLLY